MGATDSRRSIKTLGFSEEMPIFPVFSMRRVSARFLRSHESLPCLPDVRHANDSQKAAVKAFYLCPV
jgi:hypothetical protein